MPAQVLSLASAFNSGADLWVVPERKHSTLARKLDWLLNFQIAKTSQHQSLEISENIRTVLNQTELTSTEFKNVEQDCLMIASRHLLPAQWILVIKESDELGTWVNHISKMDVVLPTPACESSYPKEPILTALKACGSQPGVQIN